MQRVTGEVLTRLDVEQEDVEVYGTVSVGATVAEGRVLTVYGNLAGHVVVSPRAVVNVQGNVAASFDVAATGLVLAAGNVVMGELAGPGAVGFAVGTLVDGRVLTADGQLRAPVNGESLNVTVRADSYRFLQADGSLLSMQELQARAADDTAADQSDG